jgi:hypothetical protein
MILTFRDFHFIRIRPFLCARRPDPKLPPQLDGREMAPLGGKHLFLPQLEHSLCILNPLYIDLGLLDRAEIRPGYRSHISQAFSCAEPGD